MKSAARNPWMWLGELFPGLRGNDELYPISLRPRDGGPDGPLAGERTRLEASSGSGQRRLPLDGIWRYWPTDDRADLASPAVSDTEWPKMALPNNWYLEGLDTSGVVWFRRHFQVPASYRGKKLRLRFDGVDYFANVYLNGVLLGSHEGYFQPFEFDVSRAINFDGDNVLAVRVDSPEEAWGTVWHMRKTLIKGIFGHHDCRPGGGWGPRGQAHNTGGIWNNVTLFADPPVRTSAARVTPTLADDHSAAVVAVDVTTENAHGRQISGTAEVVIRPRNFRPSPDEPQELRFVQRVTVPVGTNVLHLTGTMLRPRLWWTWDHGEPNLYTATVTIHAGGATDQTECVFGVRSISIDDGWNWTLNGRRIFVRGSNYIPTQWLAEMDEARFRRDVELMRDANLNVIRVHAHVNREEFYRETDAAGIMVWQDFALQWGYDDSPAFAEKAVMQAHAMVDLLGQHPSIVVWCCHNESPWDASWLQYKVPDYDPNQNRALDTRLYATLKAADPTRYVHLNSGTGDGHPYPGWFHSTSFLDFKDLPDAPFVTEFGAQALPNLDVMQRMMPAGDLWPPNWDRWEFHDFQKMETFEMAGVRMGSSLEQFIENSQEYQANLIQFAIESYRRAKWQPITGLFHFMFVECWPSITWAVLDYYRTPKRGFDALRRAMQPVLPSIAFTSNELPAGQTFEFGLSVVNDLPRSFPNARLTWALIGRGNTPLEGVHIVNVAADSVTAVTPLRGQATMPAGEYCLEVRLEDEAGRLLGENELNFRLVAVTEPAPTR